MTEEEFEIRSANAIIDIRDTLWPSGDFDKPWDADTLEEIADIIRSYGLDTAPLPWIQDGQ